MNGTFQPARAASQTRWAVEETVWDHCFEGPAQGALAWPGQALRPAWSSAPARPSGGRAVPSGSVRFLLLRARHGLSKRPDRRRPSRPRRGRPRARGKPPPLYRPARGEVRTLKRRAILIGNQLPAQGIRQGFGDQHIDEGAVEPRILAAEIHNPVALGAPGQLPRILLRGLPREYAERIR